MQAEHLTVKAVGSGRNAIRKIPYEAKAIWASLP